MIGIVLAAGRGRRIGGPKGLLVCRGVPLALAHARRMLEAGASEVIVASTPEVADTITWPARVRAVVSRAPDPAGSLAIALRATTTADSAIAITPVDVLPASVTTFALLYEELQDPHVLAATPVQDDRGGHPALVDRRALEAYAWSPPFPTLHETLKKLGDRRVRVTVSDRAVTSDIDTARDAERHLGVLRFYVPAGDVPGDLRGTMI